MDKNSTLYYRTKFKTEKEETKWVVVRASFNFEDYNLKVRKDEEEKGDESSCKKLLKQKTQVLSIRGDTNLSKFPSFYIGIIHQYEGRKTEIIE